MLAVARRPFPPFGRNAVFLQYLRDSTDQEVNAELRLLRHTPDNSMRTFF